MLSNTGVRTHLNRVLKRVEQHMVSLQSVITRTYFDPTLAHRH